MSVTTTAPPQKARTTAQNIGLILSFIVLGGIFLFENCNNKLNITS